MHLKEKYKLLQQILSRFGNAVIAYSGGVDSTFLLKAGVETLGPENVLGFLGVSPSLRD